MIRLPPSEAATRIGRETRERDVCDARHPGQTCAEAMAAWRKVAFECAAACLDHKRPVVMPPHPGPIPSCQRTEQSREVNRELMRRPDDATRWTDNEPPGYAREVPPWGEPEDGSRRDRRWN